MTRILPDKVNRLLKKEYTLRFLSVSCFAIFGVLTVSLLLISSSYLLLHLYDKAYVKDDTNFYNETDKLNQNLIQKTEDLFLLSKKINAKDQVSQINVIEKLFAYANNTVNIQSVEILPDSKITIRGVAPTREKMLMFESKMKADTGFKDFSVPLEVLTRQKDISFNVTFIYHEN